MFEFEAYEVLKTKEFTIVNDCFQNEHNEKIGHYRQTLNNFISALITTFKIILLVCLLPLLSFLYSNKAPNLKLSEKTPVSYLFMPVELQSDTSIIYLNDFFPDASVIDSFFVPKCFYYKTDLKEMKIFCILSKRKGKFYKKQSNEKSKNLILFI